MLTRMDSYRKLSNSGSWKEFLEKSMSGLYPAFSPSTIGDDFVKNVIIDFLIEQYGDRAWVIPRECAQALNEISIQADDISTLAFPYDGFHLLFDGGFKFDGVPRKLERMKCIINDSRWIQAANELGLPIVGGADIKKRLVLQCDFGQRLNGAVITRDCERLMSDPYGAHLRINEDSHTIECLMDLVIKIVMLWNARPEFIQPCSHLIRESPRFRKIRSSIGEDEYMKMPDSLLIRTQRKETMTHGVTPHVRGYVLRHLRSEKYKRNEDGSIKTVLVEPCLVGFSKSEKEAHFLTRAKQESAVAS